ncbi:MAG: prepilin-type N-terminal cleavage/methylation domain-containing protein [Nitrospirae bacterium]|nr:prepilin-type N-terminal cleavage/methylation domain-containing protein [Nitrospirota bacterium]MBI3351388.1 prepilin-type N-terminal cleavage/methylation domain-containing protein [Nitrospirota bacterium]
MTTQQTSLIDRSEKGFTLLEVMIALTLVAIVFVPLLALRNQNINQTAYARKVLRAEFLANEKLSTLLLEEKPEKGETNGDFGDQYPDFRWVQAVSDTPMGAVKEISLKVIWKKGNRDEEREWVQYVRE